MQGGVLRLMPASPIEGGEAPAHAVPSAPITLDVIPVEEKLPLSLRLHCNSATIGFGREGEEEECH